MKRMLMVGAVLALSAGMAAAAVAMPVEVGHAVVATVAGTSPSDVGATMMLASVALGVPLPEKVDQTLEVATPAAPAMRAKFQVSSVERFEAAEKVKFSAVCKSGAYPPDGIDEDNTFAKWSPSASCEILITNPALHGKFVPGQKYYVDFTPAGDPVTTF